MSGRQGPSAGDGGAVDADRPAGLLPGLELFVHVLLFGDDGSQGVGHRLELLLVCVVEFVHALGERPVYNVVAACIPGSSVVEHGYDVMQQGYLFVTESCGGSGPGRVAGRDLFRGCDVFLVLLKGRDVGQGVPRGCRAAAEVVVFHINKEPALGADPLSSVPVRTCFDGVEVSFAGDFK